MLKHQELFLNTTKEYTRQINLLLGMAEKADREQIKRFSLILVKLKGSLQKMLNQQPEFKRYVNNPAKYKAILQPYIDLLKETDAEIEKVKV